MSRPQGGDPGPAGEGGAAAPVETGAEPDVDVARPRPNEDRTEHRTADGVVLRVLRWPVSEPRGRVQILHGRGEHMGRYREVAAWLNRAGYSVFGHDHRDHGESGGNQGAPGAFGHLVDDAAAVAMRADELAAGPGRPVLLGHSLGGLVAIRLLQRATAGSPERVGQSRGGAGFSGVVLSAPWLATAVEIPAWTRALIPLLRLVAPGWAVPQKMRPEVLTRDPERMRAVARDPLMLRGVAIRFFDAVEAAQGRARAGGLPEDLPTLVLIPGDDRVVDAGATRRWARGLGPNVEVWELDGVRHEPFNDVGRNIIFRRVVEWLDPVLTRERESR